MPEKNLKFSVSEAKDGKDFVGIKLSSTVCEVVFPMGFSIDYEIKNASEESIDKGILDSFKKDTRLMLKTLTEYQKEKEGAIFSSLNGRETTNSFPLESVIYLIKRFLIERTYFKEKEIQYVNGYTGKINWNRTIKQIKPIVSNNRIAYLDFIVRKNKIDENEIITLLHKYCVSKAFGMLGFLFTSVKPQANDIPISMIEKNKKFFSSVLLKKIETTHLEDNKLLFIHLLKFISEISYLDSVNDFTYGTNSYHVVWEKMIDTMFCNVPNKTQYFPHSKWIFNNGRQGHELPLEPDSIMVNKDTCFILDSKYYNKNFLPENSSIVKQIAYGQYVEKHFPQFTHIYNVFILPDRLDNNDLYNYLAYCDSDWVLLNENRSEYNRIIAITIDTRTLMENHNASQKAILSLSDFIVDSYIANVK